MSKAILISIQPKWCELMASGNKTVEVRKTKPKLETPFKVYIYCTKPKHYFSIGEHLYATDEGLYLSNGNVKMSDGFEFWADGTEAKLLNRKVIGEFVCDRIRCEKEVADGLVDIVLKSTSCVSARELVEYATGNVLYSWHISDLVIYDEPKELSEFFYACDKPKGTDCSVCLDHRENRCKAITRPPQSWCYVERSRL